MVKKINDVLAGIPATIIAGIALVCSLLLPKTGTDLPVDPAWAAVIICGIPLLYLSVWRVIHNPGISKISSALLITVAMMAAILIGDLFAAGEVGFIMSIGAIIEDKTTQRAKKGLSNLIRLAPTQGRRIIGGQEDMIPAEQICVGDLLRVRPGETIPVDGEIVNGNTSVDQSIMTGESLPVDKAPGDNVFCGTMNCFGFVDIRATNVGADSSLQKLIRMVEEAEKQQAPMQRIADKAASYLVPAAMMIAIIAFLITRDIVRAVTILVVFCPCALVLATPTAIMAAIGQATRHGVIIKSGEALEKMGIADTICFDKTGTLTYGRLEVVGAVPFCDKYTANELLALAASAENYSEHPLGKAIVTCAKRNRISVLPVSAFCMEAGKGVSAKLECCSVLCGSEKYMAEHLVPVSDTARDTLEQLRSRGNALVLTAVDGVCIGVIALSDVLRECAAPVVAALSEMQTKTVLLTGDNRRTAEHFAKQAGISKVYAELLPQEKVHNIELLQKDGHCVCMIGDGVNDAPALKTAYVGVAMGSMGSDIAVEAADIALMSDDISKIPYLKRLSRATVQTIRLSISLSLCINAAAIILSLLGFLTPTTGALWHNCGSCLVVALAALLYDRKFE